MAPFVLLGLAASAPALAASHDYKGWYSNLDLALTQPNSLDQHFANHVVFTGPGADVERLVIDNDDDFTWRLDLGYSWGKMGSLQVSYWQFDSDDVQDDPLSGGVYPTIFGYGNYGAQYIYNPAGVDYTATSSVSASTWDLDYIRPMPAGSKFSVRWLAGLRVASYEEDQGFVGSDGVYTYHQDKSFSSDSWGFRVGATAVFDFTKRFGLEAGATFAFMQGDLEGQSSQKCPDGSNCDIVLDGFPTIERNRGIDDHLRGQIFDYSLRAVWNTGRFDWFLGYEVSDWDGLVADPVPAVESGLFGIGSTSSRSRDSISFSSLSAGFRWRFGNGGG